MKVTLLQTDIQWAQAEQNFHQAERMMVENPGSDLYVLPEMWSTGFATEPHHIAHEEHANTALQWMQDNSKFKSNPKRPPFAAFNLWLKSNNVQQPHEQCSVRNLTYVNNKIAGARYPWTEVAWEPNVLRRWRVMYRLMGMIWNALSEHDDMSRNKASKHV